MFKRLLAAIFLGAASPAAADTYYVDPSAATNGIGTEAFPYNKWNGFTWRVGSTYLQKAGTTYDGDLLIPAIAGTSDAPVVFGSYGSGPKPIVNRIQIGRSTYITVSGFQALSGVIINNDETNSNITISGNDISNPSSLGVYIGGSGQGIRISGNTIHDVAYYGIACSATSGVQVTNNLISRTGSHGIEWMSANGLIKSNVISDTGKTIPGSSGLHLYAGGFAGTPFMDRTFGNAVVGNVVYNTHDLVQGDGDGIQLDQNTHNNSVGYNLVFWSDGEGIRAYNSWSNIISKNFVFNAGLDRGQSHSLFGALVLDATADKKWTRNNVVTENVALITAVEAAGSDGPFGFDMPTPVTPDQGNVFGGNRLLKVAGGTSFYFKDWEPPVLIRSNDSAYWYRLFTHSSPDVFDAQVISDIATATQPMHYTVPVDFRVSFLLGNKTVTVTSWRADTGLYGTFQ